MTLNWHYARRSNTIRLNKTLGIALAVCLCSPAAFSQGEHAAQKNSDLTVETIYLANAGRIEDALEIPRALREVLPPDTTVFFDGLQNALIVRASPSQLVIAHKIVADLDRTKKIYRLTYTLAESEAGKRIGTQHFALLLVSGQRTNLKQGSKVPVATGTLTTGSTSAQTQFTYLDVGINLDATVDDAPNGVRLRSKVEQSSIADSTVIAEVREPIIRQSVLEGTSLLTFGKPLVLGGLDIPGSTRHLDIEAMVEVVK